MAVIKDAAYEFPLDASPLEQQMYDVLKLIVAKFESDAAAVACFDLRLIAAAKAAVGQFEYNYPAMPRRVSATMLRKMNAPVRRP